MPARPVADDRRTLGRFGELAASRWYERRGGEILDRNWRVREGELDLVVAEPGAIVFVEVKTRRSTRFGAPIDAVTPAKAARLRRLAGLWAGAHPGLRRSAMRIDVASVVVDAAGNALVSATPID